MSNPNLTSVSVPFGTVGNDARAAAHKARPWSIKHSLRYLAAQTGEEELNPKKMTRAQRIALKALDKAEEGDLRAVEFAAERIDGKEVQTNINADLEAVRDMSDEQLDEFIAAGTERVKSGSDTGKATPESSATGEGGNTESAVVDAIAGSANAGA